MRVFVDANVLFSASYKSPNYFEAFWTVPDVAICTSAYCIEEVNRHLHLPVQRARLWGLVARSTVVGVPEMQDALFECILLLPPKDRPVLQGALSCGADVLVTGDETHFGRFFETPIGKLMIELPKNFRRRYPEHFRMERSGR